MTTNAPKPTKLEAGQYLHYGHLITRQSNGRWTVRYGDWLKLADTLKEAARVAVDHLEGR